MNDNLKRNLILQKLSQFYPGGSMNVLVIYPNLIKPDEIIKLYLPMYSAGYIDWNKTPGGDMVKITDKGMMFITNGGYKSSSSINKITTKYVTQKPVKQLIKIVIGIISGLITTLIGAYLIYKFGWN